MADFQFYLNRQGIRGLQGVKGDPGDSPIITVQTETPNEYILKITNPDGTELISPNLRGNKININEGTYVRYNTATGELYTSTADGATGELAGVVRLATDADVTNMDERAVVTPSQLADALSKYLVSPDGSVKITQNIDTSLTELTTKGGLTELPIASADTLGCVKIGENLSITKDGVLSSTASGDVSASGDNTFTGTNNFNGAVNLNGLTTAESLTVARNLTSSGEINAVSINSTGIRSDDIKTTTNKKYLTEEDVDNQTIQIVEGKLHANLDELGNKVNTLSSNVNNLSGEVTSLSGGLTDLSVRVTAVETDVTTIQTDITNINSTLETKASVTDLENGLKTKQDKLTFDTTPTANSSNPVTSGGIKTELDKKVNSTTLTTELAKKQNKLNAGSNITLTDNEDGTTTIAAESTVPTNMVTTDTTQTISGSKTFTGGITTTDIYPSGVINFSGTSGAINSCKQIAGGYGAGSYIDLSDMMDISGRNSLTLKGGTGGLKLTAASSSSITCENDLIAPNIRTTANGTIKLTHPMNNASGLITLSNDYGQLSISSSLGGNNNLLGVVRGTAYALINGDNITTRDKDGNERIYINTGNLVGSDNITISNPTSTVAAKIDISQALLNRITILETTVASLQTQIGEISAQLDAINGEVI